MGGDRMEAAGLESARFLVGCFGRRPDEVVRKLPVIWRARRRLIRAAEMTRPDGAVLIDFPDFHFSLGAALARRGIPVVYYVSPQVWAWRAGRVGDDETIRAPRDHAVSVRSRRLSPRRNRRDLRGTPAGGRNPGRPLHRADPVRARPARSGDGANRADARKPRFRGSAALADSSRRRGASAQRRPCRAFLLAAPNLPAEMFPGAGEAGIAIVSGNPHRLLAGSDLLLVASGTSTLEGALCGVPMVVIYRTSPLTFAIARRMVRVAHVAICNLVLGERVAPELLQTEATLRESCREADRILRIRRGRDAPALDGPLGPARGLGRRGPRRRGRVAGARGVRIFARLWTYFRPYWARTGLAFSLRWRSSRCPRARWCSFFVRSSTTC